MAYLGNAPARSFISFERQVFTIVNSQTAYALSHSVTNENDIRLVVNNVVQEPGSGKAYTATGTALTLSAALTNGTDEMYCVFLGRATATNAPGAGSVGTSQLAADSVTLAKMASGTDGNIISYDASGNPVAVATGSAGQVLTSAGAGAPPTFAAAGANTPAFRAKSASGQTIANTTHTQIVFGTEVIDTDSAFASNTFTVPSGKAGKYFIYAQTGEQNWNANRGLIVIRKLVSGSYNSDIGVGEITTGQAYYPTVSASTIVDLSVGDGVDVTFYQDSGSSRDISTGDRTMFMGFKLL